LQRPLLVSPRPRARRQGLAGGEPRRRGGRLLRHRQAAAELGLLRARPGAPCLVGRACSPFRRGRHPRVSAEQVQAAVGRSVAAREALRASPDTLAAIARLAETISKSLADGGRVWLFGNGGSAADAQHIAAELVGRFLRDRAALPAEALTVNASVVTAIA